MRITLSLVYIHEELMTYDQLGARFDKLMAALEQDIVKTKEEK